MDGSRLKLKWTEAEVFLSVSRALTVGRRSYGVQFFSFPWLFFWSRRGREPRRQTTFVPYFGCSVWVLKILARPSYLTLQRFFLSLDWSRFTIAERKMKRKYFLANLALHSGTHTNFPKTFRETCTPSKFLNFQFNLFTPVRKKSSSYISNLQFNSSIQIIYLIKFVPQAGSVGINDDQKKVPDFFPWPRVKRSWVTMREAEGNKCILIEPRSDCSRTWYTAFNIHLFTLSYSFSLKLYPPRGTGNPWVTRVETRRIKKCKVKKRNVYRCSYGWKGKGSQPPRVVPIHDPLDCYIPGGDFEFSNKAREGVWDTIGKSTLLESTNENDFIRTPARVDHFLRGGKKIKPRGGAEKNL